MYWLGIDIGTGGTRALLVDERGALKSSFTAVHEDMRMERPLWAEQRPENWWDAAQEAVRGVMEMAGITGVDVRGIGLSGQMHGLTLLDEHDNVVRPALIWCDQRSQAQVDYIHGKVGRDKVLNYTANPVVTGFTLPKLLWVRDNEPRHFERVRKVLLPKDYVRFKLTGSYATEVSDASGTSLFDVVNRRWSYEMCDALGLDRTILPDCYESVEISGKVTQTAAAALGLQTRNSGRRWGRGSSCVRSWQWNRRAGCGVVYARNLGCCLRAYGQATLRSAGTCPHVLSCSSGKVAWNGSYARRRSQLAMASKPTDAGRRLWCVDEGSCDGRTRFSGTVLASVSYGRTNAASGRHCTRCLGRPDSKHRRADLIRSVIEGVCYSQKDGLDIIESMGVKLRLVSDFPVVALAARSGGS